MDWHVVFSWFRCWIGILGCCRTYESLFKTPFPGLEAQTEEAAGIAIGYAFFHWGVSQWSVFAIVGLVIAFLQFKKGKKGLILTSIKPVIGKNKGVATVIDSLAVIATVMGVATSLGLGILQMNGGLKTVFDVPDSL